MSETERAPVMSLIKSYRTSLLNPTGVQDSPSLRLMCFVWCVPLPRLCRNSYLFYFSNRWPGRTQYSVAALASRRRKKLEGDFFRSTQ